MRFAAVALAVLAGACATPDPAPTDGSFSAGVGQVMLFAAHRSVEEEGRGYVALVYRGQRNPAETIFEQVPYDQPPVDAITTAAPGILVPASPQTLPSQLGAPGDVVAVLDTRSGAEMGVEDVSIEIIEATPDAVRYRIEVLTP